MANAALVRIMKSPANGGAFCVWLPKPPNGTDAINYCRFYPFAHG